ncbi:MAG TPA: hypothetical protein VF980_07605 [Thermoanaerobaculia bacterium]
MRERVSAAVVAVSLTAVLAPPAIASLIVLFGVNVAIQDQIAIGEFLVRNHGRPFPAIGDLFAQHNESRKVFPRLIFFYLAKLTHWNVRYEMGLAWLMACGIAGGVWLLARRSIADRTIAIAATAVAVLLVFSPVQWWNWLYGIQIVVFFPMLTLVVALLAVQGAMTLPQRAVVAAICCFVATYSYANGMILWLLVLPALLARREDRKPAVIIPWIVAAAISIGLYFVGYQKPVVSPPMTSPFARPVDIASFVAAFIGHPLASTDSLPANALLGALALAMFVLLAFRAGRAGLPWVLIGAYSIVSAATTAVGRLGLGPQTAVEPRYTTFAISIWISIVMFAAIAMPRGRALAAVALLLLHGLAIAAAWPQIRECYRDRLIARAATQLCAVLPDRSLLARLIERDPSHAIWVLTSLAKIGYVNPAPLSSGTVMQGIAAGGTRGAFEGVLLTPGQPLLYGWALMPDGRAADAVVIARSEPDGDHPVALSERTVFRPDRPGFGWDLRARRSLAIPGSVYTAWAYDTSARRAYRLAGSLAITKR